MAVPYKCSLGCSERWKSSCVLVFTPLIPNWPSSSQAGPLLLEEADDQSFGLLVDLRSENRSK
ncbi:hypothetical protein C1646_776126 [Rhizophagus diaphanus]|nr:hypothetical protein C1646_776126 [Rhizophagus diaphanus] [Rhizophagus sp. MUCL 43196]